MQWLKIYKGMAFNPKFKLIGKIAKVKTGEAVTAWLIVLEKAGDANGDATGLDPRLIEVALDLKDGKGAAILAAMRELDMLDGLTVVNWDFWQNPGEAPKSKNAERQKRYRERHKYDGTDEDSRNNAPCNASVTAHNACVTERNGEVTGYVTDRNALVTDGVTPCNGSVTDRNALKNKIKNKNLNTPPLPPSGGSGDGEDGKPETLSMSELLEKGPGDDPGIEFHELREYWNEHMRPEGPLAGFAEYKTLKKARDGTGMSCWPGLGVIQNSAEKRKALGAWNPGYEPGLAKFLKERSWLAPMPQPRASPPKANGNGVTEQNMQVAARVLAKMQNETRGKLREIGDAK